MRKIIEYKRLFAYSEHKNTFFNTEFSSGINLIYGKNTSGKSTLIQSILYTFGINDEKNKLKEVLDKKVVFRLDFIIKDGSTVENVTLLREDEILIIKRANQPVKKFIGISGDSSREHIELKEYISELIGCSLYLESSGTYKTTPIQGVFLPYYIAQDVGWVTRHKSFKGLDFVKNFKNDFFDYYLGIVNDYNREERYRLEKEKGELEKEKDLLENIEEKKDELALSKIQDEKFILTANKYIKELKSVQSELLQFEKEYILACNKLAFLEERYSILRNVRKELKEQKPALSQCSLCKQTLPSSTEIRYVYYQNVNDTEEQLETIKKEINRLKQATSDINSLKERIDTHKTTISKNYSILLGYNVDNISFDSWLKNKVNVQFTENIEQRLGQLVNNLSVNAENLAKFKTDDDIKIERHTKSRLFKKIFEENLIDLQVKPLEEERFLLLYQITSIPRQGVELLKTILAYNFAFLQLIKTTDYVHLLPLMMDAIFKEDIDESNREIILKFIYKKRNVNHQTIISVSDSKDNKTTIESYNESCLNNEAKLICINKYSERAFLSEYKGQYTEYLKETLDLAKLCSTDDKWF